MITDHGECLDASAFLVVVWCTYRMGASALIRTIAADVTRYFLVMVAIQIYIQIVYLLMSVWSFSRFPHRFRMVKCDHYRVFLRWWRLCEYSISFQR